MAGNDRKFLNSQYKNKKQSSGDDSLSYPF